VPQSTQLPAAGRRQRLAGVAIYGVLALELVVIAVMLLRLPSLMDLDVYWLGGLAVLEGTPLYPDDLWGWSSQGFVYPPFAALVFTPMVPIETVLPLLWTLFSLAAAARVSWLLAQRSPAILPSITLAQRAALILIVLLAIEPSIETLRLGQISLLLLWCIVEDTLGPKRWYSGVLLGLATAIKLYPVLFVVYLAIVRQTRAAVVAAATAVAATLLGFVVLWDASVQYWTEEIRGATELWNLEFVGNQSLLGVWTRTMGPPDEMPGWWFVVVVIVAVVGLLAAGWLYRRREPVLAVGMVGLAGFLISPVSWNFHWVLIMPLLVGLANNWAIKLVRVPLVVALVVFASRLIWRAPHAEPGSGLEYDHLWWQWLIGQCYVLTGLLLAVTAILAVRSPAHVGEPEPEDSQGPPTRQTPGSGRGRQVA